MSTVSRMPVSSRDGWHARLPQKGKIGDLFPFRSPSSPAEPQVLQSDVKDQQAPLTFCLRALSRFPKGGGPADREVVRGWRTADNFAASTYWAQIIGRAPQSTWCSFGAHQRENQKPDLVPPSAWNYFFQILLLWSL